MDPTKNPIDDLRMALPGDILIVETFGFWADIIKWVQKRVFSKITPMNTSFNNVTHACYVTKDFQLREAKFGGVRWSPTDTYAFNPYFLLRYNWDKGWLNSCLISANEKSKSSYSLPSIIGFGVMAFQALRGNPRPTNPVQASRICTRDTMIFVEDLMVQDKLLAQQFVGININSLTPMELIQRLILSQRFYVVSYQTVGGSGAK